VHRSADRRWRVAAAGVRSARRGRRPRPCIADRPSTERPAMWFSSLLQSAKRAPGPLVLVAVLALAAGYALPRPARRGGGMMDAVAAEQRGAPPFLVRGPPPPAHWGQGGAPSLGRRGKAAPEMETPSHDPRRPGARWAGVVCFKGTAAPRQHYGLWVVAGGDRCLDYGNFAVFGDPELLQEVRTILAAEGFQPVRGP